MMLFLLVGAVAGGSVGFILAALCAAAKKRDLGAPVNDESEGMRGIKTETSKRVVWFCLANGVLWVWCSYVLAWFNRPEIAQELSKVALTEIIAVVLLYCVKSLFENLSKNNKWPDKEENGE